VFDDLFVEPIRKEATAKQHRNHEQFTQSISTPSIKDQQGGWDRSFLLELDPIYLAKMATDKI